MNKKKYWLIVLMIFSLLILCGCGLTAEEKKIERQKKKEYTKIATDLFNEALAEKYDVDNIKISKVKIQKSETNAIIFWDVFNEYLKRVYITEATGKAKIGKEKFDVYVSWDEDNQENFICYDNREKDRIFEDLDTYFLSIYGTEPYKKEYDIFQYTPGFLGVDGMMQEKYDGDVKKLLTDPNDNIVLAYENLDSIYNENLINSTYNAWQTGCRKTIINTYEDSLDYIDNINFKLNEHRTEVKEYLEITNDRIQYWKNDLQDMGKFLYQGTITEKTELKKNDLNLTLNDWSDVSFENIDEYILVSDWYYAAEDNGCFYLKRKDLEYQYAEFYLLYYGENKNTGEYEYKFLDIDNSLGYAKAVIDYLIIEPNSESYFAICARKDAINIFEYMANPPT